MSTVSAIAVGTLEEVRGCAPSTADAGSNFDFSDLRIFADIPRHNHDVVPMHGLVIVFDRLAIHHEGFVEGRLYVRESQRPTSNMSFASWVDIERQYGNPAGPSSPLVTRREVVQFIKHPRHGGPSLRLARGFVDGPYKEHTFGRDLIGKVVGVYRPQTGEDPPRRPC